RVRALLRDHPEPQRLELLHGRGAGLAGDVRHGHRRDGLLGLVTVPRPGLRRGPVLRASRAAVALLVRALLVRALLVRVLLVRVLLVRVLLAVLLAALLAGVLLLARRLAGLLPRRALRRV